MNRPSFELSNTFQPFRMIAVYQDASNLDTQSGHVSNPPGEPKDNSGYAVIQDLSGSKKQLAPIVHDEGVRPIISR